jgi:hypothetical protein
LHIKKGEKGNVEGDREMDMFTGETDRKFPTLKVPEHSLLVLIRIILTERKPLQIHLNIPFLPPLLRSVG